MTLGAKEMEMEKKEHIFDAFEDLEALRILKRSLMEMEKENQAEKEAKAKRGFRGEKQKEEKNEVKREKWDWLLQLRQGTEEEQADARRDMETYFLLR